LEYVLNFEGFDVLNEAQILVYRLTPMSRAVIEVDWNSRRCYWQ